MPPSSHTRSRLFLPGLSQRSDRRLQPVIPLRPFWTMGLLALLPAMLWNLGQAGAASWIGQDFRADRVLVQPKPGVSGAALAALHGARRAQVLRSFTRLRQLQVVRVPVGETVGSLLEHYRGSGLVEFAEPDYAVRAAVTPNDPKFVDGTSWGLHNTGQAGGLADADIDAPEAWDLLTSASNVVVAVLDTGVRSSHEDLAANMWTDPRNGGHGYNALTGMGEPNDDNGHGTLISGILGAVGNNGKGIAGVAWRVQIMACKCLDSSGNGYDGDVIECLDYAVAHGAKIVNLSLDSPTYSEALSNSLASVRNEGILVVTSAGNEAVNVDLSPRYPACYDLDNIVSVAYTTRSDTLGTFSNYGVTNVDLAAPGAAMYSTFFTSDTAYLGSPSLQGTSFAAPYVAGALALLVARYPSESPQQLIRRLLAGTDPVTALRGKCASGGRLNLRKALSPPLWLTPLTMGGEGSRWWRLTGGPSRMCVIEMTPDLNAWTPVLTNTTSAAGSFDFVDPWPTTSAPHFFRAVSMP